MAQSSGEKTNTVLPLNSLELSRLAQFTLNTAHIMREPTQKHHQLNADLLVKWDSQTQSYYIHVTPHSITSVYGWECPQTLLRAVESLASRLLIFQGYTHYFTRNDLTAEPTAGVPFNCEFMGAADDSLSELPGWSHCKRIADLQITASDLLRTSIGG